MIINSVSLVKYENKELYPERGFAVIFSFDEFNDRKTTSQAYRSEAYFPVSENLGRQVVRQYTGSDKLPDHDEIERWGAYAASPHVIGEYTQIGYGHFNSFTQEVNFVEV